MSAPLVWALVLVALPLVVAVALWSTCGAVTRTTTDRCRNRRPGPLHRCHHHRGALFVRSDVYGLVAALIALGGYLLWHAAYPGPVLPRLLTGFAT